MKHAGDQWPVVAGQLTRWLIPEEQFISQYGRVTSAEWLMLEAKRMLWHGRETTIKERGGRLALVKV